MPLILVTGPTGAGKSTVREELVRLGYEAHDVDSRGVSTWFNRATGEPTRYPAEPADRTRRWFDDHVFLLSRERVEELAARAGDRPIFLCGIPSNELELGELFDRVICLTIDKETMLRRVATRTNNSFGKAPAELALIRRHYDGTMDWFRRRELPLIDATRPLREVVEDVVRLATEPPASAAGAGTRP